MHGVSRWLLSVLLWTILTAHAQIGGGSLVGNVTDPSGSPVANVRVTARNLGTNAAETTATNTSGYYEFPLLPAGRYRVEAEMTGFQRAASEEFTLNSGMRPKLDLALKIGQLSESVEVTAQAPLVNATTTDMGVVIERGKVEALPLNGRNFQQRLGASPPNSRKLGFSDSGSSSRKEEPTNRVVVSIHRRFGVVPILKV